MVAKSESEFKFGTKAETLSRLSSRLNLSTVPKLIYITIKEWLEDPDSICDKINNSFTKKVVIRSSCFAEDTSNFSQAGAFHSVLNISPSSNQDLTKAIESVIQSYSSELETPNYLDNQIIIQSMVEKTLLSGVVFTHDLNTGAPYYVVNYDDESGRTDTITSGIAESNRTLFVHRDSTSKLHSERFKNLLQAIKEIEVVVGNETLDIEFAVDSDLNVHLLQVRPITTWPNWNRGITLEINKAVLNLEGFISSLMKPSHNLYGTRTLLGRMPDWNPAEMIGAAPRSLSMSLYEILITSKAWKRSREEMGYRKFKSPGLMFSLSGQPFIDVRSSFNSFLPKNLSPDVSEKVVNCWLERLAKNKELHDKIEFDVAITVHSFDFKELLRTHLADTLTTEEECHFKEELHTLTDDLITGKKSSIKDQLKKIEDLETKRKKYKNLAEENRLSIVHSLIEDCIEFGTIPFGILARHGFIAISFLRSMVDGEIITEKDIQKFQNSIPTIASETVNAFDDLANKRISENEFLEEFGHLRPGTYDILSPRYDKRKNFLSLVNNQKRVNDSELKPFQFTRDQEDHIARLISENKFSFSALELITYIKEAIKGREIAKFIFTKNLSDTLEIISRWGEGFNLSREELSFIPINNILDCDLSSGNQSNEEKLRDLSIKEKFNYQITQAIHLPYLIEDPSDVSIVPLLKNSPNFITKKSVTADLLKLKAHNNDGVTLEGKIVMIEGADPGYDWIFSQSIKGLITKYGGANSHMAIRCAEFEIPAAIGCGEQIFDKLSSEFRAELNCAEGLITPLKV